MKVLRQIFVFSILIFGVHSGKIHQKVRRSVLSLPEGSSLSVIMDIIVPVVPLLNTTLTYLWFDLPITYDVPTAASLNDLYVSLGLIANTSTDRDEKDSRIFSDLHDDFIEDHRANMDRKHVYQYAEGFFQNFGFDGQACLKRAICELAESPMSSHGLFGKIFEILFLPTSEVESSKVEPSQLNSLPPELHFLGNSKEDEYTDAYHKGRKLGGCPIHFPACPISIFKILDL